MLKLDVEFVLPQIELIVLNDFIFNIFFVLFEILFFMLIVFSFNVLCMNIIKDDNYIIKEQIDCKLIYKIFKRFYLHFI